MSNSPEIIKFPNAEKFVVSKEFARQSNEAEDHRYVPEEYELKKWQEGASKFKAFWSDYSKENVSVPRNIGALQSLFLGERAMVFSSAELRDYLLSNGGLGFESNGELVYDPQLVTKVASENPEFFDTTDPAEVIAGINLGDDSAGSEKIGLLLGYPKKDCIGYASKIWLYEGLDKTFDENLQPRLKIDGETERILQTMRAGRPGAQEYKDKLVDYLNKNLSAGIISSEEMEKTVKAFEFYYSHINEIGVGSVYGINWETHGMGNDVKRLKTAFELSGILLPEQMQPSDENEKN